MSNLSNKASGAGRPSLMSTPPAPSTAPNLRAGSMPTRVLADLGGQKTSYRRSAVAALLVLGAIGVAAGSVYWAQLSFKPSATSAVQLASAAPAEARAPANAAAASAAPTPAPVPAADAAAAPAEVSAAKIVTAEAAPAAAATTRPAATETPPPATSTSGTTPPAPDKSAQPAPRKAQPEKARAVATAKASSKPVAVATAKPRPKNQRVADGNTKRNETAKRADPDTDLLAAMLRRSGSPQASASPP